MLYLQSIIIKQSFVFQQYDFFFFSLLCPATFKDLIIGWFAYKYGNVEKMYWEAIFFFILWLIWKSRNDLIFNKINPIFGDLIIYSRQGLFSALKLDWIFITTRATNQSKQAANQSNPNKNQPQQQEIWKSRASQI
ncbi:hypothetical protein U1Q18_036160 [Sarracenia purpurea var. burkii]